MNILTVNKPNRILWLDYVKAFCIISVISLHTLGGMPLKILLSFVMPLFFIVSGVTYKPSGSFDHIINRCKKSSIKLLLPAFVVQFILSIFRRFSISTALLSILFQRSEIMSVGNYTIMDSGILWFFSALFFVQLFFDLFNLYINDKYIPFVIVISGLVGVILGHFHIWLPLNIEVALSMQPFIYIGYLFSKIQKERTIDSKTETIAALSCSLIYCISFIITCLCTKDYLDIPTGVYPMFPLCYITAISACLAICIWSMKFEFHTKIIKPLAIIGSSTLYIYIVHSMDLLYKSFWSFPESIIVQLLLRMVIDITLALILKAIIQLITNKLTSNSRL